MKKFLALKNLAVITLIVLLLSACSNALIKSGDKAVENLNYTQAVQKYEKALSGQSSNTDLKIKLANAHRLQKNPEEAERYFQEVADSSALPVSENRHFAQVLIENNKYDKASGY